MGEEIEDTILAEQAKTIEELRSRIDQTLSYVDWLSSIFDEEYEAYLLQIIKLLEGIPSEH